MPAAAPSLIAVDVGNSRIKIGRFDRDSGSPLPTLLAVFDLAIDDHRTGQFDVNRLQQWCDDFATDGTTWLVGSVCQVAAEQLVNSVADWSRRGGRHCPIRQLTNRDVPLEIRVDEPARVGIDRLLGALAANRLREPDRAAIVVDLGTAITVDLVDADGAFAGGAILPGIGMSAQALADHTAALPHVAMESLQTPPTAPGKSTTAAIEAGLYFGAVGAIRELVSQMSRRLEASPQLFLTGGASLLIAELLAISNEYAVQHVPNLVLSGIALIAQSAGEPEA